MCYEAPNLQYLGTIDPRTLPSPTVALGSRVRLLHGKRNETHWRAIRETARNRIPRWYPRI